MMHKPIKTKLNPETELVTLTFIEDEDCEEHNKNCSICKLLKDSPPDQYSISVPFSIRGAIVWPVGRWPGYALVAGQNQRDPQKPIWIFEESPFWSVSTLDGEKGLWSFFNQMAKEYSCQRYFYAEGKEHQRYKIQVIREALIERKPSFIEAKYASKSTDNVDNLICEYVSRGVIKIDKDFKYDQPVKNHFDILSGNLATQLELYFKGHVEDEDSLPAVKALRALVAGIERVPHSKPGPPQEIPESYYR